MTWAPLLLCQDYLGHKTHADLLEHYLGDMPDTSGEVRRFSARGGGGTRSAGYRWLGARAPVSWVHRSGVDFWATRNFLIQSHLAKSAAQPAWVEADVLYVHTHMAGHFTRKSPDSLPVILSLDGTLIADQRMRGDHPGSIDRRSIAMEADMFRRADLLVTFSDWARASLIQDYQVPVSKIRVIANAIRDFQRSDVPHSSVAGTSLPLVGFVGNDLHRKGGDILISAHQRYLADVCRLVLVTADSVPTRELRNVTVVPGVPREVLLRSILPYFALLAHPARTDWSPYSVVEALAAGLPVVATSVGALPEMVRDSTNGVVLDTASEAALASAIGDLLKDERTMEAMSRESRQRYETRYNADVNYPLLLRTLRSLS